MDPLQILEQEHRMALRVVRATRDRAGAMLASGAPETGFAAEAIDFFRYFVNSCHSPKEEDLLFTALHRHGLAWDVSPLRELVGQHQELRVTLDSATDWLQLTEAGVPGSAEPLWHDLGLFLDLFERHMALEEEVVFRLARERLHARDLDELAHEFSAIACGEQQEGVHDYYAGVARSLAGATA